MLESDDLEKFGDEPPDERVVRATADQDSGRLDSFMTSFVPGLSRSHLKKIIDLGEVQINGKTAKPSAKIKKGDLVVVHIPEPEPSDILPENIPLDVLFEDDSIIVVNKQKGLSVHPTFEITTGTLVNALLHHCGASLSGVGGALRPGIIHRLDKETSGVIVVAKNDEAHVHLSRQIMDRTVEKFYTAFVCGRPLKSRGTIDAPIGRDPRNRKKMAVTQNGKPSRTEYEMVGKTRCFAELNIRLHTGRTHQIRVHMSHIGCPVAGDPAYGGTRVKCDKSEGANFRKTMQEAMGLLQGQALHAREFAFTHPATGRPMRMTAPLPPDIEAFRAAVESGEKIEI